MRQQGPREGRSWGSKIRKLIERSSRSLQQWMEPKHSPAEFDIVRRATRLNSRNSTEKAAKFNRVVATTGSSYAPIVFYTTQNHPTFDALPLPASPLVLSHSLANTDGLNSIKSYNHSRSRPVRGSCILSARNPPHMFARGSIRSYEVMGVIQWLLEP